MNILRNTKMTEDERQRVELIKKNLAQIYIDITLMILKTQPRIQPLRNHISYYLNKKENRIDVVLKSIKDMTIVNSFGEYCTKWMHACKQNEHVQKQDTNETCIEFVSFLKSSSENVQKFAKKLINEAEMLLLSNTKDKEDLIRFDRSLETYNELL